MLYRLLKIPARLAIKIYCRKIVANKPDVFQSDGPLLIAANHPNSFLDAIILSTLFDKPIYSLARGDAFINTFVNKILYRLRMLPVYRLSEGTQYLDSNYHTFNACKEVFKKRGIVLIFSEGLCVNEWHLRPLKKGTARLVMECRKENIPLKILPVGINYSSFRKLGKNVHINFGNVITAKDIHPTGSSFGKNIKEFNMLLNVQMKELVYEFNENDKEGISKKFHLNVPLFKKILLSPLALIGYIIHLPLYLPIRILAASKIFHSDHYDSIETVSLFVLYPFYMVLSAYICYNAFPFPWWVISIFLMPITAWSVIQLKKQFN